MTNPVTTIATSDATSITVRGKSLVDDLIGRMTYTEMVYFLTVGHLPGTAQTRVLDACLVTLMEHGFTPSALIARIAADSVPEQIQVPMAAGLLAIGSVFVGTMEGTARLLAEGIAVADPEQWARTTAVRYLDAKRPLPGFGHPHHKPDDPRTPRLFAVAREAGVEGRYIALLETLGRAVDAHAGRHLTINATGAIGALLLEIGLPLDAMRAMAVVSRCGGLAGHILEEHRTKSARTIWRAAEAAVPYAAQTDA